MAEAPELPLLSGLKRPREPPTIFTPEKKSKSTRDDSEEPVMSLMTTVPETTPSLSGQLRVTASDDAADKATGDRAALVDRTSGAQDVTPEDPSGANRSEAPANPGAVAPADNNDKTRTFPFFPSSMTITTDEVANIRSVPEYCCLFSYLSTSKFEKLRKICGKYRIKQDCNKEGMGIRIFLYVVARRKAGKLPVTMLDVDPSWGYRAHMQKWDNKDPVLISVVMPDTETLFIRAAEVPSSQSKGKGRKKGARSKETAGSAVNGTGELETDTTPVWSESEFARLIVLLKDDPIVSENYKKSPQPLTKEELSQGKKTTDFWVSVVAKVFNDPKITPHVDFSSVVSHIDTKAPPPVYRDGPFLMRKMLEFRIDFNKQLAAFTASGQGETWISFMVKKGKIFTSPVTKRLAIAGYWWGVGTNAVSDGFVSQMSRLIGTVDDANAGGCEDGIERNEKVQRGGIGAPEHSNDQSKDKSRRKSTEASSCDRSIAKMCDAITHNVDTENNVLEASEKTLEILSRTKQKYKEAQQHEDEEMMALYNLLVEQARKKANKDLRSPSK